MVVSGAEVVPGTATPVERHTERQHHTTKEEQNSLEAVAQETTETLQKPDDLPTRYDCVWQFVQLTRGCHHSGQIEEMGFDDEGDETVQNEATS